MAYATVAVVVGSRKYFFCTVGCDYGRQYNFHIWKYRLSKSHETAVHNKKHVFPTVVLKQEFSELTVEKAKCFLNHCNFCLFYGLMTVESNKTSSYYCNLSWKELRNGSRNDAFLVYYCHSQSGSKMAPEMIISQDGVTDIIALSTGKGTLCPFSELFEELSRKNKGDCES